MERMNKGQHLTNLIGRTQEHGAPASGSVRLCRSELGGGVCDAQIGGADGAFLSARGEVGGRVGL